MENDAADLSDAELMAASLTTPRLFGAIFDRYAPEVLRYLTRRIGPHDAEDLLSQTFLVALERRAAFDPALSARPWLYGIASNLLARRRRDEARFVRAWVSLPTDHDAPAVDDAVIARVDAARAVEDLASAVADLTPGDRDVLLLVAWAHLSHEDIAVALDIPVGTVKSRLHRARRRIRESLDTPLAATRGNEGPSSWMS